MAMTPEAKEVLPPLAEKATEWAFSPPYQYLIMTLMGVLSGTVWWYDDETGELTIFADMNRAEPIADTAELLQVPVRTVSAMWEKVPISAVIIKELGTLMENPEYADAWSRIISYGQATWPLAFTRGVIMINGYFRTVSFRAPTGARVKRKFLVIHVLQEEDRSAIIHALMLHGIPFELATGLRATPVEWDPEEKKFKGREEVKIYYTLISARNARTLLTFIKNDEKRVSEELRRLGVIG